MKHAIILMFVLCFFSANAMGCYPVVHCIEEEQEKGESNSQLVINSDTALETAIANGTCRDFSGEVVFTSGVKKIRGEWRNARTISIQEGVESIRWEAFRWSKADIFIPSTVIEIEGAFTGAKGSITVSDDNPYYLSIDGMLIETSTKTLIHINYHQKEVIIPKEVERIGAEACAFNDIVESVTMPYLVKSIGFMAFSDCTNLHSVQLSEGLQEVYGEVFFDCPIKQLVIPAHTRFVDEEEGNLLGGETGVKSLIIMSNETNIRDLDFGWYNTTLKYIAFAKEPPEEFEAYAFSRYLDSFVIYYINDYQSYWAPNGETQWRGLPIIGIDTLDKLPPVD